MSPGTCPLCAACSAGYFRACPAQAARRAERQLDDAIGGKSDSQLRDELIDNLRQVLAFELPDEGPGDQDADAREERISCSGAVRTGPTDGARDLPTSC